MWLLLIVGKFYQKVVNKYFFNMSYEPGMCLATWNISINKQKKKKTLISLNLYSTGRRQKKMYIIKKKIISYKGKVLYEKMEQIGQDRTGRGSVIKFNSGQHGKVWKKKR